MSNKVHNKCTTFERWCWDQRILLRNPDYVNFETVKSPYTTTSLMQEASCHKVCLSPSLQPHSHVPLPFSIHPTNALRLSHLLQSLVISHTGQSSCPAVTPVTFPSPGLPCPHTHLLPISQISLPLYLSAHFHPLFARLSMMQLIDTAWFRQHKGLHWWGRVVYYWWDDGWVSEDSGRSSLSKRLMRLKANHMPNHCTEDNNIYKTGFYNSGGCHCNYFSFVATIVRVTVEILCSK